MQAISLRPQRRVIVSKQIALLVLVVLIATVPVLSLPLTMVMPLFSCPLVKGKERWTALLTAPLPAATVLLYGYPPGYAVGLLAAACVPLLIAYKLDARNSASPESFLLYILAAGLSASVALLGLGVAQTGVSLPDYLASQVETWLMNHPQRTQLLYQALSTGLLPVPAGYQRVTLLTLTLDPVFLNQLLLELNTRVTQLAESLIPSLLVQGSIIVGLFTGLRVQKLRNAYLLVDKAEPQKVRIALTPSFSMLKIPERWHTVMMLFLIAWLIFIGSEGLLFRIAQLMYHTFETVYQLQGAAVVCAWVMHKNPDRRVLGGVLASVLYLLLPLPLFLLGCFCRLFPFRSHTEDDNNDERENDEEEEP